MKKINLAITGCMGRMGQQLIKSSKSDKKFKLVALTENRIINKKISGIRPNLNTFEEPLTVVILLDNKPPVQDSTNDIVSFFLLKSKFNLVISDLAPNLTGIRAVDEENIFELNIITLRVAVNYLCKSNGAFIIKSFQNSMLKKLRIEIENNFNLVQTYNLLLQRASQAKFIYMEKCQNEFSF